jgi:hypothetical protein
VLSLLAKAPDQRGNLAGAALEAILAQIIEGRPMAAHNGLSSIVTTLKARLHEASILTPGERLLLEEMLQKIADQV